MVAIAVCMKLVSVLQVGTFVGFEEEIIKNRGEKRDNTYMEEIELFYSNSNCSQQRYNK